MSYRVRVKDRGWKARLKAMEPARVRVGIFGAAAKVVHEGSNRTLGEIAEAHELGVPGRLPQRSFVGSCVEARRKEIERKLLEVSQQTTSTALRKRLGLVGSWFVSVVKAKMGALGLVKTGQLRDAVAFEVQDVFE